MISLKGRGGIDISQRDTWNNKNRVWIGGGGDSIKVEIFFASMLLDVHWLSPIWRHREERRKRVCVWVGGMIERESDIYVLGHRIDGKKVINRLR